jgi:hypothetical protein
MNIQREIVNLRIDLTKAVRMRQPKKAAKIRRRLERLSKLAATGGKADFDRKIVKGSKKVAQ